MGDVGLKSTLRRSGRLVLSHDAVAAESPAEARAIPRGLSSSGGGDLDAPVRGSAIAVAVSMSAGLIVVTRRSLRTGAVVEGAMVDGLGTRWRSDSIPSSPVGPRRHLPWARILFLPWMFGRHGVERLVNIAYAGDVESNLLSARGCRCLPPGRSVGCQRWDGCGSTPPVLLRHHMSPPPRCDLRHRIRSAGSSPTSRTAILTSPPTVASRVDRGPTKPTARSAVGEIDARTVPSASPAPTSKAQPDRSFEPTRRPTAPIAWRSTTQRSNGSSSTGGPACVDADIETATRKLFERDDHFKGSIGNDTFAGYNGNDKIAGKGGDDTLLGKAGKDLLDGGEGSDTLKGGSGKDAYLFKTATGAVDTIVKFQTGETIKLTKSVFGGLTEGKLAADQFVIGQNAGDENDHIIYDAVSGALYFDPDGDGGAAQTKFAQMQPGLDNLSAVNILVI